MMNQTALILEGGGLRGIYTSGVLRYFVDRGLRFPYVIGVSMGACNGANFVAGQPERNRMVNTRYVNEYRYMSYLRMFLKGELFGMRFLFDQIPNSLIPFDTKAFMDSPTLWFTTVTDCMTGQPLYYEKSELGDDLLKIMQASCSIPFISKPVSYQGRMLMDGGVSDSIPIRKSMADGNTRHVLILTQPKGYRKKPFKLTRAAAWKYPQYPGLCEALANRHIVYNETMDFIDESAARGDVFVIRPRSPLKAGRAERNKDVLYETYDQGYTDAAESQAALCGYLKSDSE